MKTSEKVFIAVCIAAIVIASASVYMSEHFRREGIKVVQPGTEESDGGYDVSVINSASKEDFMNVSGIGEVKAGDIIAYRDAIGGFKKVSQLKDVSGISDTIYSRIIEYFYSDKPAESSATETAASAETPASELPNTTFSTQTKEQTKPAKITSPKTTDSPETSQPTETEIMSEQAERRCVNINSASAEELENALLIDSGLAGEIIALRDKIHYFSQVQELYLCDSMDGETYRAIKNFILFE